MAGKRASRGGGYAVYLIPGVVASLAIIVVPMVMTVYTSFTKWNGVGDQTWIGFDNYTRLFHDELFWQSFSHIILLILAMAVVPTLLGLVLAAVLFDYVAKHFSSRWASLFRSGFYLPQVIPVAVTGIVWGWILHPEYGALNKILDSIGLSGLAKNWLGDENYALYSVMFIMIWFQLGYPIVMFMSGLQRIDPSLYEAADLDGAGLWSKIWHVTIPQTRLVLSMMLLLQIVATMQEFTNVFLMAGGNGPENSTMTVVYMVYQYAFSYNNFGSAAALGLFLLLVLAAFSGVYARLSRNSD